MRKQIKCLVLVLLFMIKLGKFCIYDMYTGIQYTIYVCLQTHNYDIYQILYICICGCVVFYRYSHKTETH